MILTILSFSPLPQLAKISIFMVEDKSPEYREIPPYQDKSRNRRNKEQRIKY